MNIGRRDFIKFLGISSAVLGLPKVAQAESQKQLILVTQDNSIVGFADPYSFFSDPLKSETYVGKIAFTDKVMRISGKLHIKNMFVDEFSDPNWYEHIQNITFEKVQTRKIVPSIYKHGKWEKYNNIKESKLIIDQQAPITLIQSEEVDGVVYSTAKNTRNLWIADYGLKEEMDDVTVFTDVRFETSAQRTDRRRQVKMRRRYEK